LFDFQVIVSKSCLCNNYISMAVDAAAAPEAKESKKPHHAGDEGTSIYIDPVTGQKIPMKDGKPCRTCVDIGTWKRLAKAGGTAKIPGKSGTGNNEKERKTASNVNGQTVAASSKSSSPADDAEWRRKSCPPDVEELGRSTWTLLHTMAAYYPERPAPSQMDSMKMFFEGFAQHYPCWFCKASESTI
jgi:FAD-linked sulfhydryl oxidase